MKLWKILTLALALVGIGVPVAAGFTTWLSSAVKAGVLVLALPAAVAVVFVAYFNWRSRFKRHILAGDERNNELVRAVLATEERSRERVAAAVA